MSELIIREDDINKFDKWMTNITEILVSDAKLKEVQIGLMKHTKEPYLSLIRFDHGLTKVSFRLPDTAYSSERELKVDRVCVGVNIHNTPRVVDHFTEELALSANVDKRIIRTIAKLEDNFTFNRSLRLMFRSVKPYEIKGFTYSKLDFGLLLSDIEIAEVELIVNKGKVASIIFDGKSFKSLADLRQHYYELIDYCVKYRLALRGREDLYRILVDYILLYLSRRVEEIENDKPNN